MTGSHKGKPNYLKTVRVLAQRSRARVTSSVRSTTALWLPVRPGINSGIILLGAFVGVAVGLLLRLGL